MVMMKSNKHVESSKCKHEQQRLSMICRRKLSSIRSGKHKNSKFLYYLRNLFLYVLPDFLFRTRLRFELSEQQNEDIPARVNYYNKHENPTVANEKTIALKDFRYGKATKPSSYFFDTYEYARYFPKNSRFSFLFGDVIHVPDIPSIVKSRPTGGDNSNSVLLNLDKARHFVFVKDEKKFEDKKDMLIGRASVYRHQSHRVKFWEMYFGHPMCDLGQVNTRNTDHPEWLVKPLSMSAHLDFKFILCLEGNDVATNLKWVMSSNSLAVMPKPAYETWFMEGTLIPDYHYVEISKDYSDLETKLNYYIRHPEAALRIIENAHRFVAQFQNKKREKLISLLVLQKYFKNTSHENRI